MQPSNSSSNPPGLDYIAILRGIWRRRKLLVVLTFLGIASPLLMLVVLAPQSSPHYISQAMISIEPSVLNQIPFLRESPWSDTITSHLVLLKSRSLSEAVLDALPQDTVAELVAKPQRIGYYWLLARNKVMSWLGRPPTVLSPREQAVEELRNARMAISKEALNVFVITAQASNPRAAMDLVNAHIQVLLNRSRSVEDEEGKKARQFLEAQYQQAKDSVTRGEEAITRLEQQKGRIRSGGPTDLDVARLAQLENALADTQATREVLSSRIETLQRSLNQKQPKETKMNKENKTTDDNSGAASSNSAETLARLRAFNAARDQLSKLEAKLESLRERYTEAHPLVRVTEEAVTLQQARLTQLARQLPATPSPKEPSALPAVVASPSDYMDAKEQLSALEKEANALADKEEMLKLQVTRMRGTIRSLSQDEIEFGSLRRSLEANRNLVAVLSEKLMAARIRNQGDASVIRIIDPASFPTQASSSKTRKLLVLTFALAGSLAFGLAVAVEMWHQPVETEADVEKGTGLPVLGSVGKMDGFAASKHKRQTKPIFLSPYPVGATGKHDRPIHVELYRAIRANIETERLKSPFRSVLVTSPAPNEGKSTTILNLAHVFQEFGRRVLVVEGDLRRPSLSSPLALTNKPGVVDFLNGSATFEQVCRHLPSGVAIVPGQVSRGDSASLLASTRFKELLHEASSQFDLILVDSAPILAVPDNLLLAHIVNRVILVARATMTSRRELCKAQAAVERAGGRILGVVLNQANPRDVPYYHPRYRKYYTSTEGRKPEQVAKRIPASPRADARKTTRVATGQEDTGGKEV